MDWKLGLIAFLALSMNVFAEPIPLQGVQTLAGTETQLNTPKKNALVLLWATWCNDCKSKLRNSLPELNKREDLAVFPINVDPEADRVKVYFEENPTTLPMLRDPQRLVRKELKAFSVPFWAFYSQDAAGKWHQVQSASGYSESDLLTLLKSQKL